MVPINPFSHDRTSYSMCPITLLPLNLPETVRKCCASTVLVGIIPGPNEARNLDAYIDVLVDEVVHLNSLTLFDAYKSETFSLRVNILLNIFDYPGQNKVLKCQGELYYGSCIFFCHLTLFYIRGILPRISTIPPSCSRLYCPLRGGATSVGPEVCGLSQ